MKMDKIHSDDNQTTQNRTGTPVESQGRSLEEYVAAREMKPPSREARVILSPRAVKEMLSFASSFYSPDSNAQHEVMGLLIGWEKSETELYIQRTYPVTYGSPVMVQFREEHFAVYEKLHLNENRGEFLLGWYHSHPRLGVFLSSIDINTHATSFQARNPRAVAIVIDPEKAPENTQWEDSSKLLHAIGVFQVVNPMEPNSTQYFSVPWTVGIVRRRHGP